MIICNSVEKLKKKRRFQVKHICFLFGIICISAVFFIFLLFYRPGGFGGVDVHDGNDMSSYLTHKLLPEIYNQSQYGEVFEVDFSAEGINDIISCSKWPRGSDEVLFSIPKVGFHPEAMVLHGIVTIKEMPFAVTMEVEPEIDDAGLLHINVSMIRVGALQITPIARLVWQNLYRDWSGRSENADKNLEGKILRSLFEGEGIEPVFELHERQICIESIDIYYGGATIGFRPVE